MTWHGRWWDGIMDQSHVYMMTQVGDGRSWDRYEMVDFLDRFLILPSHYQPPSHNLPSHILEYLEEYLPVGTTKNIDEDSIIRTKVRLMRWW